MLRITARFDCFPTSLDNDKITDALCHVLRLSGLQDGMFEVTTEAPNTDINEGWVTIEKAHPAPHRRYLVLRDDQIFTATVCYGMHDPWWVGRSLIDQSYRGWKEIEPVNMLPTDKWKEL